MKGKSFMLGVLVTANSLGASTTTIQTTAHQRLFESFFETKNNNNGTYNPSSNEISEILQENINKKIINGVLYYFDNDVSFSLTQQEKEELQNRLNNYLSQHKIIYIKGNSIILDLNEKSFYDLFDILLPCFAKGRELKKYPDFIKYNNKLIIGQIKKSKGKNAEKYIYKYFGYLLKRICEQLGNNYKMTIDKFLDSILKGIPNDYIKGHRPDRSNDDIRNIDKHYHEK